MKLDRTTYEAWLLDRIEGKLTPAQERELDAFLDANPDLRREAGELPSIGDDVMLFDMKSELKKSFPPVGVPDAPRLNDFLVARLEGDLDKSQEQALDLFLYEHPEKQREARLMAASKVHVTLIAFNEKPSIERHFPPQGSPDEHRLTDFLIAAEEGDLDEKQLAALDRYLADHPEAKRESRLIAASRVQRDRVVFFGKEQLKKREVKVIALWPRLAAAASIALLIGLAWSLLRDDAERTQRVAQKDQPAKASLEQQARSAAPNNVDSGSTGAHETPPQDSSAFPQGLAKRTVRQHNTAPQPQSPVITQPENVPEPAPHLANAPEPVKLETPAPLQEPAPVLAQQPVPAVRKDPMVEHGTEPRSETLASFAANTVRKEVLDAPQRDASLDGSDALALVNKGLGAITGGTGGVQVQRTATRDRWHLRLGRGLSISANTGR